ncbi:unnamed protein product [Linum trigynum]|uniref:Uncharacterized protein n=1 Tax=Linum trigynum TaxID=586398 RepID=A0AAV2GDW8_9ROSI
MEHSRFEVLELLLIASHRSCLAEMIERGDDVELIVIAEAMKELLHKRSPLQWMTTIRPTVIPGVSATFQKERYELDLLIIRNGIEGEELAAFGHPHMWIGA